EAATAHARDNAADAEAELLVRRADRPRRPDSDGIILDPPRAGARETATAALVGAAARTIVYVSFDSATLARALARLTEGGFAIESLTGFDLFPLPAHLETVTVLRRWRGTCGGAASAREDQAVVRRGRRTRTMRAMNVVRNPHSPHQPDDRP